MKGTDYDRYPSFFMDTVSANRNRLSHLVRIARYYLLAISFSTGFAVQELSAQPVVTVSMSQDVLTATDTVWVDVRLEFDAAPELRPISAYQFEVRTSDGLQFLKSDKTFTLTDRPGWTSGFSAENGRVGAFSSSAEAFLEQGVLVRLQFLINGTDTAFNVELHSFRLNSGDPGHHPAVPRLRLDLNSHEE